jgi:hypothetical protein
MVILEISQIVHFENIPESLKLILNLKRYLGQMGNCCARNNIDTATEFSTNDINACRKLNNGKKIH